MNRIRDSSKRFERIFTCSRSRRTSNIPKIIYKYFDKYSRYPRSTNVLKVPNQAVTLLFGTWTRLTRLEKEIRQKKKKKKKSREEGTKDLVLDSNSRNPMLRRVAVKRVDCRGNENEGERTNARASCHYFRHAGATCRLVRACVQRSHVPPSSTKVNKIIIVSTR